MTIHYRDFRIIPCESGYDLIRMVKSRKIGTGTINNPNGDEYYRTNELGYNMTLESCINKIVKLSIMDEQTHIELSNYIKEYIDKRNDIIKTIL